MTTSVTQRQHIKNLARLRRVNKQLAVWDELDALELMPPTLRPHVEQPLLDREQLQALRDVVTDHLEELDQRYQRG